MKNTKIDMHAYDENALQYTQMRNSPNLDVHCPTS